jgi:DNA-binding MarR family transcriptional regulator
MPKKKGPTEQDVLAIINNLQNEGILQSELWKKVKADSREGSRTILRLEKKGLIERRKELHDGRWTYRVLTTHKFSKIDSIMDIPCAFCDIEGRCGQSAIQHPSKCDRLTKWLEAATEGLTKT